MKKFLSLILALTLVASLFTVNVMADNKQRTLTVAADKTTELKEGDTVAVTVTIDTVASLNTLEYWLTFDEDVFEVDEELGWESEELEEDFANYIDQEWFDGLYDSSLKRITSNLLINKIDGAIYCTLCGGTKSIKDDVTDTNVLAGKFYLTVKSGAANGETEISIKANSNTMDNGENGTLPVTVVSETVTVGAVAPSNPTVGGTTAVADNGVAGNGKIYDNAMAVNATITPVATTTEIGVVFAPENWLGSNKLTAVLDGARVAKKTGITGGVATTIKAAIKDIPRKLNDTPFVMVTRAYAYDGTTYTYADAVPTTMCFTKTAE